MATGLGKSGTPLSTGVVNPLTAAIHSMLLSDDLRDVVLRLKQMKATGVDPLEAAKSEELRSVFSRAWGNFQSDLAKRPTLPRPPRPTELYGRFGKGCRVVDVGSGNGFRLRRVKKHLDITCVDTVKPEVDYVNWFCGRLDMFLPQNPGDHIFSSFMSVTLLEPSEWSALEYSDGIHVTLDAARCLANGTSVQLQDGRIETLTTKGLIVERARYGPGISEGMYRLIAYYRPRTLRVVVTGEAREENYEPDSYTYPTRVDAFDWSDVGYKWDGVFKEIECQKGKVSISTRNGTVLDGRLEELSDEVWYPSGLSFCLATEWLGDVYVLQRVVMWRNYVPPHCGDLLRLFAERVLLDVGGAPLLAPPVFLRTGEPVLLGKTYPVDGLISRSTERDRDVYVKNVWTVDFDSGQLEGFRQYLEDKGLILRAPACGPGLHEFAMKLDGNVVTLEFKRMRYDKRKPTSLDTAIWLLETGDLDTVLALQPPAAVFADDPMETFQE